MLCSAKEIGTHGSAIVDKDSERIYTEQRDTRTLSTLDGSKLEPITEMPSPELWFEVLLAKKAEKKGN